MSFASDARRRPNLWSYISFGSPRRQSSSLPRPNGQDLQDKEDGLRRTLWSNGQSPPSPGHNDAWMTGGQRSRFLKLGGLIAAVVFLFYLFTSKGSVGTVGVQDVVKGNVLSPLLICSEDAKHKSRAELIAIGISQQRGTFQFATDDEVLEVQFKT